MERGCVSFGAVKGVLSDPEVLATTKPNWRRNRLDFLAIRPGDVILGTTGSMLRGWGRVSQGGRYSYLPKDLQDLWDGEFHDFNWFRHIIGVDWAKEFADGGIAIPDFLPSLPTVRRPANSSAKSWRWLREQGVPVTDNGAVLAGNAST